MPVFPTPQTNPQQIKPAEYNAVQAIIAEVMGQPRVSRTPNQVSVELKDGTTGTTDITFGYNQTLSSSQIPASTTRTVVTADQLFNLRRDILRARLHQLGDTATYRANVSSLLLPYVNTTATSVIPGASVLLTGTTAGSNAITLNQSTGVYSGGPIVFSQTIGGLTSGTIYYIDQLLGNNQFTLKTTFSGTAISPVLTTTNLTGSPVSTTVYSTLIVGTTIGMTVGGALKFSGTPFSSLADNSTYYIVLILEDANRSFYGIVISDNAPVGNNPPTPAKSLTQGTGSMSILGTGTYASKYDKISSSHFQAYANVATDAWTERLSADTAQLLPVTTTVSRDGVTNPWGSYNQPQSLTQTITIDFGGYGPALAYFNSGSYIELEATLTNPDFNSALPNASDKNVSWNSMFANMGKLRIQRTTVIRTNTTGSGVTLAPTLGFLNLTTTHQQIVSVQPTTTQYTQNRYTVTAKKLGTTAVPTGIEIIVKFHDLSNFLEYGTVGQYVGAPSVNIGGGPNTTTTGRIDESVTGLLTSILNVVRSQGTEAVSIPTPTTTTTQLVGGDSLPVFTVTPDNLSVVEGTPITWTVTSTNFTGSKVYYTIDTNATSVGNGYPNASDFTDGLAEGEIIMTSGSGSLTKTLKNDTLTEGLEALFLRIRVNSTTGQIVANSPAVKLQDTSFSPPPVIPPPPAPTGNPPTPTPDPGNGQLNANIIPLGVQQLGTGGGGFRQTFAIDLEDMLLARSNWASTKVSWTVSLNGFQSGFIDTTFFNSTYPGNGVSGISGLAPNLIYWNLAPPSYGATVSPPTAGGLQNMYKPGSVSVLLSAPNYNSVIVGPVTIPNWYNSTVGGWTSSTAAP